MTAPGTGDNEPIMKGEASAPPSPSPSAPPPLQATPQRDLIPIPVLVGIFAMVLAIMYILLIDNWRTDWTRFQSMKAQQEGDWKEAVEQLEKLVEAGRQAENPVVYNSPTYLAELGYAHLNLGEYDKALEYYQQAQQHRTNISTDEAGNPRPPVNFSNMIGITYYRMGKYDEAEKALQDALQFSKLDPLANFTMGEIAMKRGNYTQAADYFKTVATVPGYEDKVKKYYAEIEQQLFAGIS
jgi:tetratricopeptide (TPR) repeat protein